MSVPHRPTAADLRTVEALQTPWLTMLAKRRSLTYGQTRPEGNPLMVVTRPEYNTKRVAYEAGVGLVYYRSMLKNEIVIESDASEPATQLTVARSVWDYCARAGVPFVAGHTGGKSIHFHIFFDPTPCIEAVEGIDYAEIDRIDPYLIARNILFEALVKSCGLSRKEFSIDESLHIDGSTSQGHLIREFGCPYCPQPKKQGEKAGPWNGKYKTQMLVRP